MVLVSAIVEKATGKLYLQTQTITAHQTPSRRQTLDDTLDEPGPALYERKFCRQACSAQHSQDACATVELLDTLCAVVPEVLTIKRHGYRGMGSHAAHEQVDADASWDGERLQHQVCRYQQQRHLGTVVLSVQLQCVPDLP